MNKVLKNCDFQWMCHLEVVNMVVDALGGKSVQVLAWKIEEQQLIEQFRELNLKVKSHRNLISCGKLNPMISLGRSRRSNWKSLSHIVELLGS